MHRRWDVERKIILPPSLHVCRNFLVNAVSAFLSGWEANSWCLYCTGGQEENVRQICSLAVLLVSMWRGLILPISAQRSQYWLSVVLSLCFCLQYLKLIIKYHYKVGSWRPWLNNKENSFKANCPCAYFFIWIEPHFEFRVILPFSMVFIIQLLYLFYIGQRGFFSKRYTTCRDHKNSNYYIISYSLWINVLNTLFFICIFVTRKSSQQYANSFNVIVSTIKYFITIIRNQ